jgi:hypothetical protein
MSAHDGAAVDLFWVSEMVIYYNGLTAVTKMYTRSSLAKEGFRTYLARLPAPRDWNQTLTYWSVTWPTRCWWSMNPARRNPVATQPGQAPVPGLRQAHRQRHQRRLRRATQPRTLIPMIR